MLDMNLIKHILKYELKWGGLRALFFGLICLIVITSFVLLGLNNDDKEYMILILMCTFIITLISSSSSLLPVQVGRDFQGSQSGVFSWKYIHSTFKDRKSFVVGTSLASAILSMPGLIVLYFGLISLFPNSILEILFFPVALLIIIQLRLLLIIQLIEFPRIIYFKYSNKSLVARTLRQYFNIIYRLINIGLFIGAFFFSITLLYYFNFEVLLFSIPFGLIFIILYSLRYLIRVWRNERLSIISLKRDYKKTLVRVCILVLSLCGHEFDFSKRYDYPSRIFSLVKHKKVEQLKKAKISMINLKSRNDQGLGLIHIAILNNDIETFKYLLSKGALLDFNVGVHKKRRFQYRSGFSPLMLAIDNGLNEIVDLIIQNNVDLDYMSSKGFSAISIAVQRCEPMIIKLLKDQGANIEIVQSDSLTPLFYSFKGRGCISAFLYLKRVGVNLKHTNIFGESYIDYALRVNPRMYQELQFIKSNDL